MRLTAKILSRCQEDLRFKNSPPAFGRTTGGPWEEGGVPAKPRPSTTPPARSPGTDRRGPAAPLHNGAGAAREHALGAGPPLGHGPHRGGQPRSAGLDAAGAAVRGGGGRGPGPGPLLSPPSGGPRAHRLRRPHGGRAAGPRQPRHRRPLPLGPPLSRAAAPRALPGGRRAEGPRAAGAPLRLRWEGAEDGRHTEGGLEAGRGEGGGEGIWIQIQGGRTPLAYLEGQLRPPADTRVAVPRAPQGASGQWLVGGGGGGQESLPP